MHFLAPTVCRLAHTTIDRDGLAEFVEAAGALGWTSDALTDGEQLLEACGRICYRSWAPHLNLNVRKVREGNQAYIANLLEQRHFSVLEHVVISYCFLNVSRVFTHELVRHRHLSFSQESLRFVRLDRLGARLPEVFRDDPWAVERMRAFFEAAEQLQREFAEHFDLDHQDFARKKAITSAMRRCAPMGLTTNIVASGSLRSWREVVEKRASPAAEEEIREVIGLVRDDLRQLYPNAMGDLE